ncbi:MAG: energy transducer TonB [Prevotella sp.]|nr:energy transducer TonB [Prevotella sp.]
MKVCFLSIVLSLSFISYCNATPQTPDLLVYKGDTVWIYPFILAKYIMEHPNSEAIREEIHKHKDMSTACWRGFKALFEIKNDSLFLIKAYTPYDKKDIDLSIMFKQKTNIYVDWFSGTITSPRNCIIYEHDGWGGYHEYETDYIFEKGILKSMKTYRNKLKPSVFTNGTDTLSKLIKANINYKSIEPPKEKLRVTLRVEDADLNGKITEVKVIKGHDGYNDEAIRIVKSIPWEVIIRRGKKIHRYWTIPIIFEPQNK